MVRENYSSCSFQLPGFMVREKHSSCSFELPGSVLWQGCGRRPLATPASVRACSLWLGPGFRNLALTCLRVAWPRCASLALYPLASPLCSLCPAPTDEDEGFKTALNIDTSVAGLGFYGQQGEKLWARRWGGACWATSSGCRLWLSPVTCTVIVVV
jgi:hypothetical protein